MYIQDAYAYFLKCRPSIAQNGLYSELPTQLRNTLINDVFYREIKAINIFNDSDNAFITQIIEFSKPQLFTPGDIIFEMGDCAHEICFLISGSVSIISPGLKNVLVGCCTAGGFFGDFEFFKNSVRTVRYEAVHKCTLLAINFEKIL